MSILCLHIYRKSDAQVESIYFWLYKFHRLTQRRIQKFREEWKKEFSWIEPSKKGICFAFEKLMKIEQDY